MQIEGSRVGIVGGSIAGCAAAIAVRHVGAEPVVFERSRGELRDRGAGILIPDALCTDLRERGYVNRGYRTWQITERLWLLRDGAAPTGRVVWRQKSRATTNNWGLLWESLRSKVPDADYREGVEVEHIERADEGWVVRTSDGEESQFDVILGADGYRSSVRALLHRNSRPSYAGYILWRGTIDENHIRDRSLWDQATNMSRAWKVCIPGGQGTLYAIPGFDGGTTPGRRRVNWAVYCSPPDGTRFEDVLSVPPDSVTSGLIPAFEALLEAHFPPYVADLIRLSIADCSVFIQPIYDMLVTSYVDAGGILLIGDASTIVRPHTGSGATKALGDAVALERICADTQSWENALTAYDAERCEAGRQLVELGRRMGRDQVERTPEWTSMTPEMMQAWADATLAGQRLYFYGDGDDSGHAKQRAGYP